jgi:hypothetical protein
MPLCSSSARCQALNLKGLELDMPPESRSLELGRRLSGGAMQLSRLSGGIAESFRPMMSGAIGAN